MASLADVQYCMYADTVGGSEKVQNYADVIYAGCSFSADLTLECSKTYSIVSRVSHPIVSHSMWRNQKGQLAKSSDQINKHLCYIAFCFVIYRKFIMYCYEK